MSTTELSRFANLGALVTNPDSTRYQELQIALIESKEQPRKKFSGLESLADSLKAVGLIQPIIVSPRNDEGKYVIQKGERRFRAAKLAGWSHIKAIIADEYKSREQGVAEELVENIQREDLEPLEIAEALRQLNEDHGMTYREIASILGVNKNFVGNHLKLLKTHSALRDLIDDGVVRDLETISALDVAFKQIPDRVEEFVARIRNEGITRAQARELATVVREEVHEDSTATKDAQAEAAPTQAKQDDAHADSPSMQSGEGAAVEGETSDSTATLVDEGMSAPAVEEGSIWTDVPVKGSDEAQASDETHNETDAAPAPDSDPTAKGKPQKTNQYVDMLKGGKTSKKTYLVLPPDEVVVQIVVRLEDEQEYDAALLFDHIDMREGYVCVMLEGDEQPIGVRADQIVRLKEVRAIDDGEN